MCQPGLVLKRGGPRVLSRQFPALRGIAILLVILNHSIALSLVAAREFGARMPSPQAWAALQALQSLGLVAVPIFLFLSGSYLAYAVRGKDLVASYRTILLSLRHILVPYVLWSLGFYVLIFLLEGQTTSVFGYIKNLLVGYPFEYVPLAVFCYLLAPFIVRAAEKSPGRLIAVIAIYQLFSAIVIKPGLLGFALPEWARLLTIPGLRTTIALWAVFFPLGVVYSLHTVRLVPSLQRIGWLLVAGTAICYGTAVIGSLGPFDPAIPSLLTPVFAVLLLPLIRRETIPAAGLLESVGRRAYGLYLTNLIFLSLALLGIQAGFPWLLGQLLLLAPLLFVLTTLVLQALMSAVERTPVPMVRRYVFG